MSDGIRIITLKSWKQTKRINALCWNHISIYVGRFFATWLFIVKQVNHIRSRDYYSVRALKEVTMIKTLSGINAMSVTVEAKPKVTDSQLVDEYAATVYKFCRSITSTKYDADDLFQDTFLNVFSNMSKIDDMENAKSFLLSTAAYLWKSQRRKYARRHKIAQEVEINEATDPEVRTGSIEDEIVSRDEQRVVRRLVEALPDKLKTITIMYYTNELSVADISTVLGIPAGTVKSRLHKARKNIEKGLVIEYGC